MQAPISLSLKNRKLLETTHIYCWIFKKQFGFFPDRNGCSLTMTENEITLLIERDDIELTPKLMDEIAVFFENEDNFTLQKYENMAVIDLDFEGIVENLQSNLLKDIDVLYVGCGSKQKIYFRGRPLTDDEKRIVKQVLNSFITLY